MKSYGGQTGTELRELPVLLADQAALLDELDDAIQLHPRVEILCAACARRLGQVYDAVDTTARDRAHVYRTGPVVVLATKAEPGAAVVFIDRPGAPRNLPCSCRRDGSDVIATAEVLDAVRRDREHVGKRRRHEYAVEVLRVNG